uniref:Uncharacterized protein n=1 Tax=Cacopsylla melanoneura TaxID=428564 RepID=A0A8D8Z0S0_9HEMI
MWLTCVLTFFLITLYKLFVSCDTVPSMFLSLYSIMSLIHYAYNSALRFCILSSSRIAWTVVILDLMRKFVLLHLILKTKNIYHQCKILHFLIFFFFGKNSKTCFFLFGFLVFRTKFSSQCTFL